MLVAWEAGDEVFHVHVATCGSLQHRQHIFIRVLVMSNEKSITHAFENDTIAIAINNVSPLHSKERGLFLGRSHLAGMLFPSYNLLLSCSSGMRMQFD